MKKLCTISLMLILMNFISSCEKDRDTDIEIIQRELKQVIDNNNITKCDIVVIIGDQYLTQYSGVIFSIDNGSVIINKGIYNEDTFNLIFLTRYTLTTDGEKKIIMFFSS